MSSGDTRNLSATIGRFSGFAREYDRHRPSPPAALAEFIEQFIGAARPTLVVDLGSGTGLSTRYWADRADHAIGVEPSADMRDEARRQTNAANVQYLDGVSHATGLPDHCARVVTCVQALHWMIPEATFTEARRVLEPGGIFVAIDYDWPPVTRSWRADQAWAACAALADRLEATLPGPRPLRWEKSSHQSRMDMSGCFRFTREAALHHVDHGHAARLVGLLRTQGGVMDLLRAGHSEATLGIVALEATASAELGSVPDAWYWTARIRIGVV